MLWGLADHFVEEVIELYRSRELAERALSNVLADEPEEVDLMRVLVLDRAPGERAGVDQGGVEPDLTPGRVGLRAGAQVDRHGCGDDAPVEQADVECDANLGLLPGRAAVEDVVAAARRRRARPDEGGEAGEREEPAHTP